MAAHSKKQKKYERSMKEKALTYDYKNYITKVMANTAEKYINISKTATDSITWTFYKQRLSCIATHCRFI